jgi:hypothetical protein
VRFIGYTASAIRTGEVTSELGHEKTSGWCATKRELPSVRANSWSGLRWKAVWLREHSKAACASKRLSCSLPILILHGAALAQVVSPASEILRGLEFIA